MIHPPSCHSETEAGRREELLVGHHACGTNTPIIAATNSIPPSTSPSQFHLENTELSPLLGATFLTTAIATELAGIIGIKLRNEISQYGSGRRQSTCKMKYRTARVPILDSGLTPCSSADFLISIKQLYAQIGAKCARQNGIMSLFVFPVLTPSSYNTNTARKYQRYKPTSTRASSWMP